MVILFHDNGFTFFSSVRMVSDDEKRKGYVGDKLCLSYHTQITEETIVLEPKSMKQLYLAWSSG